MKKTLSIVALLLAVVMIALCCAACGDDKKSDSGSSDASIVGSWKTEIDFDKYMNAAMGSAGEGMAQMMEGIKDSLSGLKMKMFITFNEDGTCVVSADEADVEAASSKILNAMTAMLQGMGLSEEQIAAAASSFDLSALTKGQNRKYELDGNKVYMFDDEDPKNENEYVEVEISSSELKVVKAVGEDTSIPAELLPIVFTKA